MGALQRLDRKDSHHQKAFSPATSPIRVHPSSRRENPILHLQRTVGNQAVMRLQAQSRGEHKGSLTPSRGAPPIVHEVLNSPGRPLNPATRQSMELAYGRNFSQVRVHTDERAAQSARAVEAQAYATGEHVAFASDAYRPDSSSGWLLIAHELAHVAQQRNTSPSPQGTLEIGNPGDRAEQEAQASAHVALATAQPPPADARPLMPHLSPSPIPVLRRAPLKTWAGEFEAKPYDLKSPDYEKERDGTETGDFDINIGIAFTPSDHVSATKIGFVQTADTLVDGVPEYPRKNDPKGITETRWTDPALGSLAPPGIHMDVLAKRRSPLYTMYDPDPAKGDDLAASGETKYSKFAVPSKARRGVWDALAWMYDTPDLRIPIASEASQTFESTALAVEGPQKGAYYGSVKWGWAKKSSERVATKIDFQLASRDVPTSDFKEAAELFNASQTSSGKSVIPLPVVEGMYVNIKKGELLDDPAKSKSKPKHLADLPVNTRLEVTAPADPKGAWRHVIVVDGPQVGKAGWVKASILSDRKTDTTKKK